MERGNLVYLQRVENGSLTLYLRILNVMRVLIDATEMNLIIRYNIIILPE